MTFDAGSFPIVHAVTDSNAVMHESFIDRASAVMRALGPRGAIHLRSSRMSGKEFYELAVLLANFQKATGCWLIVNDRVDVAAAVGAKGVQLASHSMRVRMIGPASSAGTIFMMVTPVWRNPCLIAA